MNKEVDSKEDLLSAAPYWLDREHSRWRPVAREEQARPRESLMACAVNLTDKTRQVRGKVLAATRDGLLGIVAMGSDIIQVAMMDDGPARAAGRADHALPLFAMAAEIDKAYGMPRYSAAKVYAKLLMFELARVYLEDLKALGRSQCKRLMAVRSDPDFGEALRLEEISALLFDLHCEEGKDK